VVKETAGTWPRVLMYCMLVSLLAQQKSQPTIILRSVKMSLKDRGGTAKIRASDISITLASNAI
jgi:hypothetical protein